MAWCGWAALAMLLQGGAAQLCSGQQNFPEPENAWMWVTDLQSGVPANQTLCPQHWVWYRIQTRVPAAATTLSQSGPSWSLTDASEEQQHSLSIMLDAGYDNTNHRFTTLSFIAVNGTPPTDILQPNPYEPTDYSTYYHVYEEYTDRETLAFGYNDTVGGTCQQTLANYVFFGVRCVHPLGTVPGPCSFNLTVTLLPQTLRNGMEYDAYLRPVHPAGIEEAVRHYYRVPVTSYEVLAVDIERTGDGRPLFDSDGEPLGLGLSGAVYAQRAGAECPANNSLAIEQMCVLGLNTTTPCTVGHACASDDDPTADLVLMVEAIVDVARPVTYIDATASSYCVGSAFADLCQCEPVGNCEYVRNVVDQYGQRPLFSSIPGAEGSPPRYNLPQAYVTVPDWHLRPDNKNELRADRGVYHLKVTQLQYSEGLSHPMQAGERRPGCVSYGQWRYFVLYTSGAHDASISVHLTTSSGKGVAGVYVKDGGPPTELHYLAMVERPTVPNAPQRLTASPCDLNSTAWWWIGVYLEDKATAMSKGVPPTRFELSVHLEDSVLPHTGAKTITPRLQDDPALPARGLNGSGYVCCGAFKYFLVPKVAAHLSLSAVLTVTSGVGRAVYLKGASCPAFPDDVTHDTCNGHCVVDWLTRFNPYDGTAITKSVATPLVPNGLGAGCPALCPPDLRLEADWYVGVQALPGTEAEFSLSLSVIETPPQAAVHECDPSEPRCRGPIPVDAGSNSAGVARHPTSAGRSVAIALALAAAASASAIHGCASSRRRGGGSGGRGSTSKHHT